MAEHFILRRDTEAIVRGIGDDAHMLSGKTVLLSGGAGFLGKHFLRVFKRLNDTILERPVRVLSVDNFITGDPSTSERDENIAEVWADVTYPLPVREDIHYIMHAAGLASPVYYMKYPLETIESAVSGIKNLLELGRRNPSLEGFLFFSSSEIYGDPDPRFVPTPETYHGHVSSVGPRACYDESKRLAETIATIYHQKYDLPVTIVRPFNVFGPGMKHNDRRVVPMFTYRALTGEPIPVHGDGLQTRTFCYTTDAITGFLKVLLRGRAGEPYNIGNSANEISMLELAELYAKLVPGATFQHIDYPDTYPAGEPQRRCPDLSKATEELEYQPEVDVQDGLARFIDWAKDQESYRKGVCDSL
ncbi:MULTISPECIES: NAD-dependent epimerase/dehydratase family protein [unclassified Mycobacterium]|uniref:NAD-dependent epimerase/dehydratase family protein n=1 Tax=unclassified Mycobacterium TaxID=2642494 RepID=UPI0007FF6C09|nr:MULTISPECIES: NAD-dependent epimerase/dehydratase family protein [unclassified Mycobacterium]OBG62542.1 nucleoside-diphosphate sugar epimerase [Mycobacterium sp. E188]OBH35889.1 nucleoside-diphosphate sugar epimerase [Mycobacterium sp. E183]